jgi:hypothetical protein
MIPGLAKDLAYMLGDAGVEITLGAGSTHGRFQAAGAEESSGENAPGLDARIVTVLIATGSLPGLADGATITVAGVAHRVRRNYPDTNPALTRIIARRFTAVPPDLWLRATQVLDWAERGADAEPSAVVDLDALEGSPVFLLEALAATSGTGPALIVAVHHADLAAGSFTASGVSFDEVSDEDSFQALALDRASGAIKRYVRLVPSVTGTDDPSFWCQAALLDAALPR